VRRDAAVLAAELAQQAGSATLVHVSGCEKGCAHPRPAPLTFVARNGRYDLVRDGTASDPPSLCNLTLAQAAAQTRLIVATPAAGRTA
jgi:precorrin-3B synthase